MEYRSHQGFEISALGVGCYALSGAYGPKDPQQFKAMLHRAHELGVNFFDTAEGYGDGERILGQAVKPFRNQIYLATKVGVRQGFKPNLSKAYILQACEDSLRRLGTETIDLYQVHFDDPHTPVEETLEALRELVQAGKIRRYGIGHLPPDRAEVYFQAGEVFSALMELSAAAREARAKLLPLCRQYHVAAIAFSVTGRGLLTGRYGDRPQFSPQDIRSLDPLFQRERLRSSLRVAQRLAELGRRYGKTPVQVAIAWVLAQPGVVCALTGPSSIAHLEENVGGTGWRPAVEDLQALDAFLQAEDRRLRRRLRASLKGILSTPLPQRPLQAFTDLLYAMESALLLGLVAEKEILPLAQELYALRKGLGPSRRPQLEQVQRKLGRLVQREGPGETA